MLLLLCKTGFTSNQNCSQISIHILSNRWYAFSVSSKFHNDNPTNSNPFRYTISTFKTKQLKLAWKWESRERYVIYHLNWRHGCERWQWLTWWREGMWHTTWFPSIEEKPSNNRLEGNLSLFHILIRPINVSNSGIKQN